MMKYLYKILEDNTIEKEKIITNPTHSILTKVEDKYYSYPKELINKNYHIFTNIIYAFLFIKEKDKLNCRKCEIFNSNLGHCNNLYNVPNKMFKCSMINENFIRELIEDENK